MTPTEFESSADSAQPATRYVHLTRGDVSVVLDAGGPSAPTMLHWGRALGPVGQRELADLALALKPQRVAGGVDEPALPTLIPGPSGGWTGTPGLEGHRLGRNFSTAFTLVGRELEDSGVGTAVAVFRCEDADAELALDVRIELFESGLMRQRLTITNLAETPFELQQLRATFPVPHYATEVLDTAGRWMRERSPQRHNLTVGAYSRSSRKGRPGADATGLLVVGEPGFGFRDGDAWGIHVGWSGNHTIAAEKNVLGESVISGGELLMPGELALARQGQYESPWVYGGWGSGLDAIARQFHVHLRATQSRRPNSRPATLNTWEAVYFDHDLDKLSRLADEAVSLGIERFVLDDGWFEGRRSDTAGLGDWYVDSSIWPRGIAPLIDHVTSLGMQFGLWVEPEMVNLDSELARNHPEWILKPSGRMPLESRQQHVLNLANTGAFEYIFERLHTLLSENDIAYLKWDHNRDLLEAGDALTGRALVHEHTLALYRLIDRLRELHPTVDIENCASGGSRLDVAILERTDRMWTSDCNDPLERINTLQYTGLIVPPEMLGAHIGESPSHTTGRATSLRFAAVSCLIGHLGVERDLTRATPEELAELAAWVAAYKEFRGLVHTGDVVNIDHPDPAIRIRGVVARDQREAIFIFTQLVTSVSVSAGRFTLAGLNPTTQYRVALRYAVHDLQLPAQGELAWGRAEGVVLSGSTLATVGLLAPAMHPEQVLIISVTAT